MRLWNGMFDLFPKQKLGCTFIGFMNKFGKIKQVIVLFFLLQFVFAKGVTRTCHALSDAWGLRPFQMLAFLHNVWRYGCSDVKIEASLTLGPNLGVLSVGLLIKIPDLYINPHMYAYGKDTNKSHFAGVNAWSAPSLRALMLVWSKRLQARAPWLGPISMKPHPKPDGKTNCALSCV